MSAAAGELVGRLARVDGFDQAAELLAATSVPLDPNLCENLLRTASRASREGDGDAPVWQRVYELIQEYRYRRPRSEFFAPPEARRFVAMMAGASSGEEMMRLVQPFIAKLSANEVSALRAYPDIADAPDAQTAERLAALAAYLRRQLGLELSHSPPSRYLELIRLLHGSFQSYEMQGALDRCRAEIDLPFAYTLVWLADELLGSNRLDEKFVHFIEGLAMHLAKRDPGGREPAAVAVRLYRYLLTLYDPVRHAPLHARTLENLAGASLAAADAEGAGRALEQRLSLPIEEPDLRFQLVLDLASIYLRAADVSAGAEGYRRAASLYREQGLARLPEGRQRWLECAYLLAECTVSNPERTAAELAEARQLLERCEQAWKETGDPQQAAVLDLLGAVLLEEPGDRSDKVEAAIDYLERAAEEFAAQEASGRDRAIAQNRLGHAYRQRLAGDPGQNRASAARCFEAAAAACPATENADEHFRSLHNLAMVLGASDRLEELRRAIELVESCLEHDTLTASPLEHARDLLAKANLHRRAEALGAEGERAAALATLEAALEIPQAASDRLLLAALQATYGGLLAEQLEPPADVESWLRRALETAEAVGDRGLTAGVRYQLGGLCRRQGDPEEALAHYRAAIEAIERDLEPGSSEEFQLHVERQGGRAYEAAIGLLIELDRPFEALDHLERNKARTLGRRIAGREAEPSDRVPADLAASYRALRQRQRHLETRSRMLRFARRPAAQELADVQRRMPEVQRLVSAAGVEVMTNQAQLERLEPLLAEAVREIREHDAGFDPRPAWQELTPEEVAEVVGPGSAVVELVVTDRAVHLFVLTVDDAGQLALRALSPPGVSRAALGEMLLRDWLEPYHRYRQAVLADLSGIRTLRRAWRAAIAGIGARLGDLLDCAGVLEQLSDAAVERIVFVPYQLLHLLPLHLMPGRDGGPLCDVLEVSYAPSLRILKHCRRRGGRRRRKALVIQDPDASLTFSGLEVALIRPLLGDPQVLVGEECRWRPVISAMAGAEIVHYSGHAYFEVGSPLASALVLADRRLTLGDLLASALLPDCSLVVLSACETSQVSSTLPADEYAGLPAGFLDAGAAAVLGSLWVVEDSSGPLVMQAFYRRFVAEGCEPGVALHDAIRAVRKLTAEELLEAFDPPDDDADPALERLLVYCRTRKDKARPLFDHPEHWAAYTLVGAAGGQAVEQS